MRPDAGQILQVMGFRPIDDYVCYQIPGGVGVQWLSQKPQPTDQEIDAAALPTVKFIRLGVIRTEARRIIEAKYPSWRQMNMMDGTYGVAAQQQYLADKAAVIDASNVAENAVINATTEAQVAAVTPVWPNIGAWPT